MKFENENKTISVELDKRLLLKLQHAYETIDNDNIIIIIEPEVFTKFIKIHNIKTCEFHYNFIIIVFQDESFEVLNLIENK